MTDTLTPENYRRYYEWDQLDYELRTEITDKLSKYLNVNNEVVDSMNKVIKSDQDWWLSVNTTFKENVLLFLRENVYDRSWVSYWAAAVEKSIELIIESRENGSN